MDVVLSIIKNLCLRGCSLQEIKDKQHIFFQNLKHIQELVVINAMSEHKENDNLEKILYDVSYDSIYRVLEMIDGYWSDNLKMDLIDKETGQSLRKNIELHDKCADYLRTE